MEKKQVRDEKNLTNDIPQEENAKSKRKRSILAIFLWIIITTGFLFVGLIYFGTLDEIKELDTVVVGIKDFARMISKDIDLKIFAYVFFGLAFLAFLCLLSSLRGKKRKIKNAKGAKQVESDREAHVGGYFENKKKKKHLLFWFILFVIFAAIAGVALAGNTFIPEEQWIQYINSSDEILKDLNKYLGWAALALACLILLIFLIKLFKKNNKVINTNIKSDEQYKEIVVQDRSVVFENVCVKYGIDKSTLARFQPVYICNPTSVEELKKECLIKIEEQTGNVLYSLENFQIIFFDAKKIYLYSAVINHANNHVYKEQFASYLVRNVVGLSTKINTQSTPRGYKEVLELIFTFSNGLTHKMVIKNRLSKGIVDSKDLLSPKETEILNQLYTLLRA